MSDIYFPSFSGRRLTFNGWGGCLSWEDAVKIYNLYLEQQTGGAITADAMSGLDGNIITLSNTPSAGYQFDSYSITGAELSGNQFAFNGSDVTAAANFQEAKANFGAYANATATLAITATKNGQTTAWNNNGGTAFRDVPFGSEITVTSDVPTYWRVAAGTPSGVSGWTTAAFSRGFSAHGYVTADGYATTTNTHKNSFTATGTFNWSDWTQAVGNTANKSYNAILKAFTGSKPSNWPATNGNWNVTNASAYAIKANTTMRGHNTSTTYGGYRTISASILIGGTRKVGINSASQYPYSTTAWVNMGSCNLGANTTQGQLAWSGKFRHDGYGPTFVWNMSVNNWSATGYAP